MTVEVAKALNLSELESMNLPGLRGLAQQMEVAS